ncbi:hypothetical protein [Paenibacillus silvisoli]|uniref:hypothetical protein n=1 Tax=Paenibacillus silvisoli TaxID=3110539 RepID=UPI002804096E|nr:hypothetical protein [Paenibacillus silvisoli]
MFALVRPLRKYMHYVERAAAYESLFLRRRALETMKRAVIQPFTDKEIASGLVYLGLLSLKMKNHRQALDYFDQSLDMIMEEPFPYSSNFGKIIKAFIRQGDKERAQYWLNQLLAKQSYDRRFKRLEKYREILRA